MAEEEDAEHAHSPSLVAVVVGEGRDADAYRHLAISPLRAYDALEERRDIIHPVLLAEPGTRVAVREESDIYILYYVFAVVQYLVFEPHEVVELLLLPLVALLPHEETERGMFGIDLQRVGLIIGEPAREHLLADSGEVLVDEPVAVVVAAVQPILVRHAVLVVVGRTRQAGAADRSLE